VLSKEKRLMKAQNINPVNITPVVRSKYFPHFTQLAQSVKERCSSASGTRSKIVPHSAQQLSPLLMSAV
jgi:hypothetical protein